jgi:hypothetical protein
MKKSIEQRYLTAILRVYHGELSKLKLQGMNEAEVEHLVKLWEHFENIKNAIVNNK